MPVPLLIGPTLIGSQLVLYHLIMSSFLSLHHYKLLDIRFAYVTIVESCVVSF